MHIELRYMGMRKTLKVYIFVIEHGTDIIPVSFYPLNSQLSFDTQHLIFIHCINSQKVEIRLLSTLLTSRGQKVKSEVSPNLKVIFMVYANHVSSFMFLSQIAQRKCLAALLYCLDACELATGINTRCTLQIHS